MSARQAGTAAFEQALRQGASVHDAERAAQHAYTNALRTRAQKG